MALAVPKTWSARVSGAASLTINLTAASILAGDLLHVETSLFDGTTLTVGAPTDSAGNTYTQPPGATDSGWTATFRSIIGSARTVVGTAPTSVVVKKGTGGNSTQDIAGVVCHVTGADTSAPLDQANANHVGSSSAPAHTAMTTTNPNDVLFVGLTHDGGNLTCTKPTGFTQGETNGNGATGEPYANGYEIVSSIQTAFAPAWSLSGAANIGLCFTSYKAAAGGGGGGTTIACSAIPSSETWGRPTVQRLARALAAATAEAFGILTARRMARAAGIPASETWSMPTVQRITRASGIASSEQLGTPTVRRFVVEQTFGSSEAWGKPLVQGGIYPSIVSIVCSAIATAELWGTPTVQRALRAQQITSAEQFGVAILQRVARTAAAGSGEAWGTPTLRRIARAAAATSAEQWGIPTVRRSLTALNITTGEAWGIVLVQGGTIVITPFQPGQILLADLTHTDVFVADGETWAIGISDAARFDIDVADRPGG